MLCRRQAKRQRIGSHTPQQPMAVLGQAQAAYAPPLQPHYPPAVQYQPPQEMRYQQPGKVGLGNNRLACSLS